MYFHLQQQKYTSGHICTFTYLLSVRHARKNYSRHYFCILPCTQLYKILLICALPGTFQILRAYTEKYENLLSAKNVFIIFDSLLSICSSSISIFERLLCIGILQFCICPCIAYRSKKMFLLCTPPNRI